MYLVPNIVIYYDHVDSVNIVNTKLVTRNIAYADVYNCRKRSSRLTVITPKLYRTDNSHDLNK